MRKPDSGVDQGQDDISQLSPDDAALVVSASGEISLFIPHYEDDEEVPPLVVALGVLAVKLQDQSFVAQLLAELDEDED